MEEVAQLSAMKCSATVDAARDTVSAARDTGDLCVKQSLGNDVVESVLNVKKNAICALNQARAAAVCAEDSLAYSRQINKKLAKTLKYAVSQMQDISKKLQETASFCYTDEDHADGSLMTGVARSVDELAEILDQTSLNCQVELMDPNSLLESGYRSEDSAVWADVFLDEELDRMFEAQTLGEHCVMYDLDFEEMWDRSM
ncbi:hypothetical protein GUJ93_ZPchr0007g3649 [Zizania palustris]|uniref:Uncharacterized protein n=1 Tax=Zizania palustris TaxID=103762 RepID=A0A8J5TDS3_ZIZPA|nr:hypothetical protein GUJ93_ZPchr0007g3649 [Zizania palustris]